MSIRNTASLSRREAAGKTVPMLTGRLCTNTPRAHAFYNSLSCNYYYYYYSYYIVHQSAQRYTHTISQISYILCLILPAVLCGCETWSLTLRKKRRLSVFENRVLRTIFGSKRDEVTGEWRKLHNEELNDMYCLMICTA